MKTSKLKIMFLMLLFAAAMPLFAQNELSTLGLSGLENFSKTIQGIFTGTIVRVILTCCLAGCGIAYGFNKDNEKMKRNLIAIAIGIAIIAAASVIVQAVFDASK
jgi:type IV secretory pathway VirB2 component (pilin)